MFNKLSKLLLEYKINKHEKDSYKPTHTAMPGGETHGAGSYHIPLIDSKDLHDMVYDIHFNKGLSYHLTESHDGFSFSPFIDDIDTRDPYEDNPELNRLHTIDDIKEYCFMLMEIVEKYCQLSDEQRFVYVFQKSKPVLERKTNKVKDGWHIMIPHLVAPYQLFYLLRSERVMNGNIRELFQTRGYDNDINDIIDHRVIEIANWMMYGAGKPTKEPYKLIKVFKYNDGNIYDIDIAKSEAKDDRYAIDLFSIRNKSQNVVYHDGIDIQEIYDKLPENFKSPRDHQKKKTKTNTNVEPGYKKMGITRNSTNASIPLIRKYISCLLPERVDGYDNWIKLGWCLHNIDYCLLTDWIEFSRHSKNFDPDECRLCWDNMRDHGLSLGTLRMWARQDNPKKYSEIREKGLETLLYRCRERNATHISNYVSAKYEGHFVCASIALKEWYHFTGHRWKYMEDGWVLRDKIANEVCQDFQIFANKMFEMMQNVGRKMNQNRSQKNIFDDDENTNHLGGDYEGFKANYKIFSDLAVKLGDSAMLNNVMAECRIRFLDEEFKNKLDTNDNLLHFTNGIYDLQNDTFREGYPEDYVSLSTKLSYVVPEDEEDWGLVEDIDNFFEKVLPIPAVKDYTLTLLSSFLSGKVDREKFYIWTGSGSNGKSLTINLFEQCMGDYASTLSIAIFTNPRPDANGPTPEIAKLKGKRFVSLQEPEHDAKLKTGMIKQWTGDDTVQGRELHKSPIEFKMKAKMVLICNDLPQIETLDGGTWRRIELVEFISKFIDNPKRKYEFPIDRTLKDQMKNWKELFMWLLIQYYKRYKRDGVKPPPEVTKVTDEYKRDSDFYSQFFNEHITQDMNNKLSCQDAYKYFKHWVKIAHENKKAVTRPTFIKHMDSLMSKAKNKYWYGYKYVEQEEKDGNMLIEDDFDVVELPMTQIRKKFKKVSS